MEKETTNEELLRVINESFSRVEERMEAIELHMATKTDLENSMSSFEQHISMKADGIRTSLDAEILRRADEYSDIIKRLTTLEKLHGISGTEPELQIS